MKIQYCSDLHLEFASNWRWLESNPILPVADILLVAGDSYYLGQNFSDHEWFDYASDHWKQVFLIPGNHEFYGGYDANICLEMDYEMKIRENVTLLNNTVREVDNVRLIFTALWSKIEREIGPILGGLNDFRLIQCNNKKLTIENYNLMFEKSWSFLKAEMNNKSDKKKVVVTHHLPSNQCNLERYKGNKLNEAFCVDLTDEIMASDVDFWIYGHSHGNKEAFKINNTTMLTNQLGYVDSGEVQYFKGSTNFDI